MEHNYFSLKLLQLIYAELGLFERLETEYEVSENIVLEEELVNLEETVQSLHSVNYSPSKKTIDSILAYAKL